MKNTTHTARLTAAAVTVAIAMTACQPKPATRTDDDAATSSTESAPDTTESGSTNQGVGAESSAAAVAVWVTHVLSEEYTEACMLSATALAEEAGGDAETLCASGGDGFETIAQLHEAWAKPGIALPPDVEVTVDDVEDQGDTATVPDTAIRVGDTTLREIELIGSSGDTDSFELALQVQKQDGLWYVTGTKISA